MTRLAAGYERAMILLVGLLLLVLGAATLGWEQDWIPGAIDRVDASAVVELTTTPWWPWVVGAAGVLLVVIGMLWLGAHTRRRTVGRLRLAGSGAGGRLSVDSSALVDAAEASFDDVPGLQSRGGRILNDQHELVVELRAAVSPGADLADVVRGAEAASGSTRSYLGDDAGARFRMVLIGGRRPPPVSRVR